MLRKDAKKRKIAKMSGGVSKQVNIHDETRERKRRTHRHHARTQRAKQRKQQQQKPLRNPWNPTPLACVQAHTHTIERKNHEKNAKVLPCEWFSSKFDEKWCIKGRIFMRYILSIYIFTKTSKSLPIIVWVSFFSFWLLCVLSWFLRCWIFGSVSPADNNKSQKAYHPINMISGFWFPHNLIF